MQGRGTATDRLADIIQVVQLARKSGLLTVERGDADSTFEEGSITFVDGRVTDARAGQMSGGTAYNWLCSWGSCRFAFIPSNPSKVLQPITEPLTHHSTGKLVKPDQGQYSSTGPVPYRVRDADEVLLYFDRLGLSRTHRRLFLLINGQRNTTELVQLMGRRPEEVHKLLSDLERAGLIQE